MKSVRQMGAYHRTLSRQNLWRFLGRAHKFWDQFDEYDSQELRCVKQTSEKAKIHKLQVKSSHQRSPYAVKIVDRTQEETARQERCARGDAWIFANNTYKLKETEKAAFYSLSDEWILLAASTTKPEEGEFVVDSGASLLVVSKRDLNSAELKTMRTSKSPTTVMTANGEALTKEEETVYVKDLDSFVTVMLLEDTLAGISLSGSSARITGITTIWTSGQKPHLIKNGRKTDCKMSNYVPFVVLGLTTSSSISSSHTSPTSSSQETVTPTESSASTRSESMSEEVGGNS